VQSVPSFLNVTKGELHLGEIFKRDLESLGPLVDSLQVADVLFLGELYSQEVTASAISSNSGSAGIVINTPLVYFLNSFFSKYSIISSHTVGAGCLEEHEEVMASDAYSDAAILSSIFNEAEVFYNKQFIRKPISPPYMGAPYDPCERVEGARRFIILHEIGHLLADRWRAQGDEGIDIFKNNLTKNGMPMSPEQAESWAIELWCDEFAVRTFNQVYKDRLADDEVLYESANQTCGVLLLLFMIHLLETGFRTFDNPSVMRPPAKWRYHVVLQTMNQLKLYQHNHVARASESFRWNLKNAEQFLFAGLGADPRSGPLCVLLPTILSPFGLDISRAIFNDVQMNSFFS
jgi:hypothetical protein